MARSELRSRIQRWIKIHTQGVIFVRAECGGHSTLTLPSGHKTRPGECFASINVKTRSRFRPGMPACHCQGAAANNRRRPRNREFAGQILHPPRRPSGCYSTLRGQMAAGDVSTAKISQDFLLFIQQPVMLVLDRYLWHRASAMRRSLRETVWSTLFDRGSGLRPTSPGTKMRALPLCPPDI